MIVSEGCNHHLPFSSLNECKPILAAARASDVCSDRMLSVLGPCESSPGLFVVVAGDVPQMHLRIEPSTVRWRSLSWAFICKVIDRPSIGAS